MLGGDDYELEIDLTAETPDGLVPIRWVGPLERAAVAGNGASNGNGTHPVGHVAYTAGSNGSHGHGTNGNGSAASPVVSGPRVATLASFIPEVVPARRPTSVPQVIEVLEPELWHPVPDAITVGRVMASRGARILTVVGVLAIMALFAAVVLLWQRVEEPHRPVPPPEVVNAATKAQMVAAETRLNRLETRLASLIDPTGAIAGTPESDVLANELARLRTCLNNFQAAVDEGRTRGGQFEYC